MAKNYTFVEAVKIINAGTDLEAITDIGRRFPVLLNKVTKVTAKAGEDFIDLMSYMPDYLTANKVNTAIKAGVTESGESVETESDEAETKAHESEEKENTGAVVWNESMSGKQLWDLLGNAGKRKLAKSTKKADLIEACKQAFGAVTEAEEKAETKSVENEAKETETEVEDNPYKGKTAVELFKECKARKIKAEPKKPAKYYIDLLVKDDAAKAESNETESDDWDEDETSKAEEKKPAKKVDAKPAKKAEAESEDDDWDI